MIWIISTFYKPTQITNPIHTVSILLSVYNEENVIEKKIKNISELKFDFRKLELIVGSDASNDDTEKIVTELQFQYDWLKFYKFSNRRGKAMVLNDLVEKCENKIIIFTDANSLFQKDSLEKLIEKFSDNSIGGISGRLVLKETDQTISDSNEERRYWEYETFIKKAEGRCGSLIGANGGIYAIRKNLFTNFPVESIVTDDLFLTIAVLQKKKKFCYAEDAVAFEEIAPTIKDEFKRKARFSTSNFGTLRYFGFVLKDADILTNFCYLSHKVIRWILPVILLILPILNIIIVQNSVIFKFTLIFQATFLSLAIIGFLFSKIKFRLAIFSIPFYFLFTNLAIFLGLLNFLMGKRSGIWQPTPRQ